MKKKNNKIDKEQLETAPWLKFYDELGYPTSIEYPECTIYELLEETVEKYPDYYAFEYFGKRATFKEFDNRIRRCAQSLLKIGVTKDDTVTILMPNTPEGIIMFYACNLIGAVANMIHPLSSEAEIVFGINKTKSKYVLTLNALYDKLHDIQDEVDLNKIILSRVNESMPALISSMFMLTKGRRIKIKNKFADNVIMWNDFIFEGRETALRRSRKDDTELAVILYSGGTTGMPKAIMHNSRTFNVTAYQNKTICPAVQPGNSMLSLLPIFHGFGLGVCFHTVLVCGMKAIIIPKFTPADFGKFIKTYKPNFIAGVPTLYEALVQTNLPENGLSFVSTAVCGGDLLTPDLQKKVNQYLKEHGADTEIRVGWGMTECVAAATATPEDNFLPESIGIPNPDNFAKIVNPETTENAGYDTDGELCVRGPLVMMGYLDDKEETANTLKVHDDGHTWLHTGDMASMNKEGMIFFRSRIKRMIITAGYNVYPNHVESVINSHPKVLSSIVVGKEDDYKGEIPIAYVVLAPEFRKKGDITDELMSHCKKNLSKYMWPTSIEFRDELPVTKIGKPDYRNVQ